MLFLILTFISLANVILSFVYNAKGLKKEKDKKLFANFIRSVAVIVILAYIIGAIYLLVNNYEYWKLWGGFVIFIFACLLISAVSTFMILKVDNSYILTIQLSTVSIVFITFLVGSITFLPLDTNNYYHISTKTLTPFNENIDVILSEVGSRVNISYCTDGKVENVLAAKKTVKISNIDEETPTIITKSLPVLTMNIFGKEEDRGEEIEEVRIAAKNIANREILEVEE